MKVVGANKLINAYRINKERLSDSFLSSSSICLFMNEGWPLSGHERVTEARLLLRRLV